MFNFMRLHIRRRSTIFQRIAVIASVSASLLFVNLATAKAQSPKGDKLPTAATKAEQTKKKPENVWLKLCNAAANKKNEKRKSDCLTFYEILDGETGLALVSAAVRKVEGEEREQFLVMVPLGMAIPPGVQVQVDKEQPIKLKYLLCHALGCTAETPASKELLAQLKKGEKLVVAAINAVGKQVGFPVSLSGFGKAYDGKPVDNEKYKEARKKLMVTIRKRREARAKKAAEQQKKGAPNTTGANPKQ